MEELQHTAPSESVPRLQQLIEAIRPLRVDSTLADQCQACFDVFTTCVRQARIIADLSETEFLTKQTLIPIARKIDEQRLRFDIWMVDCEIESGNLPTAAQEPNLHEALTAAFQKLHTELRSISFDLSAVQLEEKSTEDLREIDVRISSTAARISSIVGELTSLQSTLQMAQAIHFSSGPQAALRQKVEQIGSSVFHQQQLQRSNSGEGLSIVSKDSGSLYEEGEECLNCHQKFPWHVFSFHQENCQREPLHEERLTRSEPKVDKEDLPVYKDQQKTAFQSSASDAPTHSFQLPLSRLKTTSHSSLEDPARIPNELSTQTMASGSTVTYTTHLNDGPGKSKILQKWIDRCTAVSEVTNVIEICAHVNGPQRIMEERNVSSDDLDAHLNGSFWKFNEDERSSAYMSKIIFQEDIMHTKGFAAGFISLPKEKYLRMLQEYNLPSEGINSSGTLGQFFWSAVKQLGPGQQPFLQMVYRSTDYFRRHPALGVELILSYNFEQRIVRAFYKGTPSNSIARCIDELTSSHGPINHPMLLPSTILGLQFNWSGLGELLEVRERLITMELEMTNQEVVDKHSPDSRRSFTDIDKLDGLLADCRRRVLSYANCQDFASVIEGFRKAMGDFRHHVERHGDISMDVQAQHEAILSKLDLYDSGFKSFIKYFTSTSDLLDSLQISLNSMMSCRIISLHTQTVAMQEQVELRDSSILEFRKLFYAVAILCLPGAFLALFFSTHFFGVSVDESGDVVFLTADNLWLYFAISVPVTAAFVFVCWCYYFAKKEAGKRMKSVEDIEAFNSETISKTMHTETARGKEKVG